MLHSEHSVAVDIPVTERIDPRQFDRTHILGAFLKFPYVASGSRLGMVPKLQGRFRIPPAASDVVASHRETLGSSLTSI